MRGCKKGTEAYCSHTGTEIHRDPDDVLVGQRETCNYTSCNTQLMLNPTVSRVKTQSRTQTNTCPANKLCPFLRCSYRTDFTSVCLAVISGQLGGGCLLGRHFLLPVSGLQAKRPGDLGFNPPRKLPVIVPIYLLFKCLPASLPQDNTSHNYLR